MPNILVRGLPDDVHAALQRKAEQSQQSLQQYLTSQLRRLAERREVSDVLDGVEAHNGGRVGVHQAVQDLREERARA